jgi:hypothetical protein
MAALESLLKDKDSDESTGTKEDVEIGQVVSLKDLRELGYTDIKSYTDDMVKATYAFKTAAIAAKGYLMLLDQMGLSPDQKKMVKELEYGMMAVMKAAQAVAIGKGIMEAATLNPMAILTLGGYAAGSIAYTSKLTGGGV